MQINHLLTLLKLLPRFWSPKPDSAILRKALGVTGLAVWFLCTREETNIFLQYADRVLLLIAFCSIFVVLFIASRTKR
jgi:membrane-associated HD superfamily phosphohydrolase